MALVEMVNRRRALLFIDLQWRRQVFQRAAANRCFTFQEISRFCSLPEEQVELLLMKAFSLKVSIRRRVAGTTMLQVVRGRIDQVAANVLITWVQPRVLDRSQVGRGCGAWPCLFAAGWYRRAAEGVGQTGTYPLHFPRWRVCVQVEDTAQFVEQVRLLSAPSSLLHVCAMCRMAASCSVETDCKIYRIQHKQCEISIV